MDDKSIAILGGGISGLSLAWYLQKHFSPSQITVYEKTDRPGGVIATENSGRFFFERGPRTFSAGRCPELLSLIEEIGLKDELIFAKPQKRFIFYKGKLRPLQTMALRAGMHGAVRDLWAKVGDEDETIRSFATRRFGRWTADYLMDPVTRGIYAGSIDELSMVSCFACLKASEQKHGSVMKAMRRRPKRDPRLFTLRGGMQKLIEALADRVQIKYGEEPKNVMFKTVPEPDFVKYTGLTVVHLGFDDSVLKRQGFGYLVPSIYGQDVLGVVFDSCVFPQQNRQEDETRLSVMMKPCDEPLEGALKAVREHLGIRKLPHEVLVSEYAHAVPQMTVGHAGRMKDLQKQNSDVILAGSYLTGPAVNTCIKQAQVLSDQAFSQAGRSVPVYA